MKSQHTVNMIKYLATENTNEETLTSEISDHIRAWNVEDLVELLEELEVAITYHNTVCMASRLNRPLTVTEYIEALTLRHLKIEIVKYQKLNPKQGK